MKKILINDDEKKILGFLKEALEDGPYFIDTSSEGAISQLLLTIKIKYDLLITDYRMPKMNGGELAHAIRSDVGPNQFIPIIFISGYLGEAVKATQDLEGISYLDKPILIPNLVNAIKKALKT